MSCNNKMLSIKKLLIKIKGEIVNLLKTNDFLLLINCYLIIFQLAK